MANEFEKDKKFIFAEEVDYSNGGIVSKNVIKRETGNISLFAFDKGESLSTHSAPFDALIQVVEGNCRIVVDSNSHNLTAGESIILPASIPHSVEATERFKMLLTMIKD